MPNQLAVRSGWGNIQSRPQTVTVTGGNTWTVEKNVGVGINIKVVDKPVRLSYIHARTQLDIPAGDASSSFPDFTCYRLMVLRGNLPPDVSTFQGANVGGSDEEPLILTGSGGLDILDDWTYQPQLYALSGAKLPDGTNSVQTNVIGDRSSCLDGRRFEVHHVFGDSGPIVFPTDQLSVILIPMLATAAPPTAVNNPYSTWFSLSAHGHDVDLKADTLRAQSLPRFDIRT